VSGFDRLAALVARDLLVELRSREVAYSTLVFALLVLLIFNFTFELRVENLQALAPGVLWVTFIFAAVLALSRLFAAERDRGALEGLLLCPVDRGTIYLAKLISALVLMLAVQAVAVPVFIALFGFNLPLVPLGLVAFLGSLGFASVGTLFSALAAHTRTREGLLPLLLFPISVPVIIATVKATGGVVSGDPWDVTVPWLELLAGFDVLFIGLSYLVFELAVEE
jgi:heme exporter protein B